MRVFFNHNETRGAAFQDDRKKENIPESRIHDIIHMYYIWKDYEVIDEILKYKITKMNKKADIKDLALWQIGFGRKFCNTLFKYTSDKITDWDEKAQVENY